MGMLVGYMEGTNPEWLTTLQVLGCDTMPLSNGFDGHGLNIQMITRSNKPDVVLCWLHKLISPKPIGLSPKELLHAAIAFNVHVLVACPAEYHSTAERIMEGRLENVRLVEPEEMLKFAKGLIE